MTARNAGEGAKIAAVEDYAGSVTTPATNAAAGWASKEVARFLASDDGSSTIYTQTARGRLWAYARANGVSTETINYKTLYPISADIGTVYTGGSGTAGAVTSGAELGTALTSLSATGGTIVIDSAATISAYTITAAPSAQIMIRGVSSGSKGKLPNLTWDAATSPTGGITFKWCDFGNSVSTSGTCLTIGSASTRTYGTVKVQECLFYGPTLDPNGAYTAGLAGINTVGSFGATSTTTIGTLEINGCSFSSIGANATRVDASTSCVVFNNTYDLVYEDASGWTRPANSAGVPIKLYFNRYTRCCSLSSDTGNPHADAFQVFASSINQDWNNCEIIGNIIFNYGSRGNYQGIFSGDMGSYYINNSKIAGNLIANDQTIVNVAHLLTIEQAKNCYIFGNRCLGAKPGTSALGGRMLIGNVTAAGVNYAAYNVNAGTPTVGSGTQSNATNITTINTANYQAVMDWPSDPTTVADLITAARWKAGQYLRDYIDYDACTVVTSLEPAFVPLLSSYNVATGLAASANTSNIARLTGGKATQSISISGGEYQVTSDAAGSSVVTAWTSSAGTIARGNYVQVRHASAATEVTTTTTTLTIGSTVNTWSSTTLDSSVFPITTSAGAYSANTSLMENTTSYSQFIIALRFKQTSAGTRLLMNKTNANNALINTNGGSVKVQIGTSTTVQFTIPTSAINTVDTVIVSMDFSVNLGDGSSGAGSVTETENFAAGVKAVVNGAVVSPTYVRYNNSNGALTSTLAGMFGQLGLLNRTDGLGTNFIGDFHFAWLNGYNGTMPDITNPAFYNKFSAQLMNGDGSAVDGTFGQPLLFFNNQVATASVTAGTGGASSTTLTVTATSTALKVGQVLSGTGISGTCFVKSFGTYNGSTGTVILNAAQTIANGTTITSIGANTSFVNKGSATTNTTLTPTGTYT